jgi:hypothetical protein
MSDDRELRARLEALQGELAKLRPLETWLDPELLALQHELQRLEGQLATLHATLQRLEAPPRRRARDLVSGGLGLVVVMAVFLLLPGGLRTRGLLGLVVGAFVVGLVARRR